MLIPRLTSVWGRETGEKGPGEEGRSCLREDSGASPEGRRDHLASGGFEAGRADILAELFGRLDRVDHLSVLCLAHILGHDGAGMAEKNIPLGGNATLPKCRPSGGPDPHSSSANHQQHSAEEVFQ